MGTLDFTWISSLKGDRIVALTLLVLMMSPLPLMAQGSIELYADADSGIGGRPAIAADGTNFLTVWVDGSDVYGARISHAGTILDTTPIAISTAAGEASQPSVGYDGANYLVVWASNATAGDPDLEMYAARVSPAGTVLSTDIQVTTAANPLVGRPFSLAFDGTNYLIVWRTESTTVMGARVTTTGTSLDGDGFLVSSVTNSKYPWVAFGSGSFLVAFHASATNGYGVYGVHVDTDGALMAPGVFLISDAVGDEAHASVVSGTGNFLVAWYNGGDNYQTVSGERTAHAARVDNGTVLDVPAIQVSDEVVSNIPVLTAFDGTDYLVVWNTFWAKELFPWYSQAKIRLSNIFARRLSTSGVFVDSEPFPVEVGSGHRFAPRVAFDGGALLIVWSEGNSERVSGGPSTWSLFLRTLDAQATAVGAASTVQTPVSGGWSSQTGISIAHLYDVFGVDDSNVFAVSEANASGFPEVLRYDGKQWMMWASPPVVRIFSGWAATANDVYISGWCSTLHSSGSGWSEIVEGLYPCGHTLGIWGTSATNVIGVATQGRAYHFDGTMRTEFQTGVSVDLWDVGGTSATDIFAVGPHGTVLRYDGMSWAQETGIPTSHSLNSVWASGTDDVFAVGDFGRIIHYDGNSWNLEDSGTDDHLFGVSGNSASEVYAVGMNGTIVHYNGTNWQAEISGTTIDLWSIWVGTNNAWTVGSQGTILTRTVTAPPVSGGGDDTGGGSNSGGSRGGGSISLYLLLTLGMVWLIRRRNVV